MVIEGYNVSLVTHACLRHYNKFWLQYRSLTAIANNKPPLKYTVLVKQTPLKKPSQSRSGTVNIRHYIAANSAATETIILKKKEKKNT